MNIGKISKDFDNKEIISNKEENESLSFDSDIEEKYNKLYSNFDVKEKKYDFWDTITNKINNKIQESNKLNNIHHFLEYKNYQIINDNDFSSDNKIYNDKAIKNNPQKNNNGRNKTLFNYFDKNKSMNSITKKDIFTYELDLDENKVYNRLYNRGFYVKNKIIINKIKDQEDFSKTMSGHSYINPNSKKILLFRNNSNNNMIHKINKSINYYKEDETFKPNINNNSIRIVKRLHIDHKYLEEKKFPFEYSFNSDKTKINKIKYDIFRNNYKNLYNHFNNSKYSNFNKNMNKSQSQRIMSLHKRNLELYKNKNNESEKNNDETDKTNKKNEKIKIYNIYENNKKWEKLRDDKIKKIKEKKERNEIIENKKDLELPGKQNYEKYKNLIIKFFSPKEKPKTYALIQKKNNIYNKNINSFVYGSKINEIKSNKSNSKSKNKIFKQSKYHPQKLRYINNEGKELFLFDTYFNVKNDIKDNPKKNNINNTEFAKLVKENQIKDAKNKNHNKVKSKNRNNKIITDKNSLEYKLKNIKKILENKGKKKY